MTNRDQIPVTGLEFEMHTAKPNWKELCIVSLKARKKEGVTLSEIISIQAGGVRARETYFDKQVKGAMDELIFLGVATHMGGDRYCWWRHAKGGKR